MMEAGKFNISKKTGFLAEKLSQKLPGDYFNDWELAVRNLPQLTRDRTVKATIDALPEKEFSTRTLSTEAEWQWAYVIVSYLGQAYIFDSVEDDKGSVMRLPSKLAIPWHATARHLGVLPAASYAAFVLYNYTLKDPAKPIEAGNLQPIVTFTGSSSESWFYIVHILEEMAAAPGLDAIMTAYQAISSMDNECLARCLKTIAESLYCMKNTLKRMYDQCTPTYFYNKLRPLFSFPESGLIYSGVSTEVKKYSSVSGAQDSAIPAFSTFLGVKHGQEERELADKFRLYMPAKHREFLEALDQQPSVSSYVQESGDVELIKQYDEAVGALASFRSQHVSLVTSYIINVKQRQGEQSNEEDKGTGGTPFMRFLKKVRDNTNVIKSSSYIHAEAS